jgi:hypothetical protein
MWPTPERVHSFLRAVKGLAVASYRATKDSPPSDRGATVEKWHNERAEDEGTTRGSAGSGDPVLVHQQRIEQERAAAGRPEGVWGVFSRLGDLPEWNVPGKKSRLRGKALNTAISWVSCLAFLMFGYAWWIRCLDGLC